jgi:hypothetical protein
MKKLGAVVVVIALGLVATAGVTASSATPYAPRVGPEALGVNAQYLWQYPSWYRQAHLKAMSAAGMTVVRREVNWSEVEPQAPSMTGVHTWFWGGYDSWVTDMAVAGVRWEPVLGYSAIWASSYPYAGSYSQFFAPARDTDFMAYATAVVQRYGRGGSFWAEHPELPALPITTYEIWNEQNSNGFWNFAPDPARYAQLYIAARYAVRAADPQARVLVGGLARAAYTGGGYYKDTDFVAAMYQSHPELRGNVDGIGYHPYSAETAGYVEDVLRNVVAMRQAINSPPVSDPKVPIEINEIGWPTAGVVPAWQVVLTEAQRTQAVRTVADQLIRSDCGVDQVLIHSWMTPENTDFPNMAPGVKERYMGIANLDGTLKPTAAAYSDLIHNLRGQGSSSPDYSTVPLCSPSGESSTSSTSSTSVPPTTSSSSTTTPTTMKPTTTTIKTTPTTLSPGRGRRVVVFPGWRFWW